MACIYRIYFFLIGFFGLLFMTGCRQAEVVLPCEPLGNTFQTYTSTSRTESVRLIPDGDHCLCFARGGLQLEGTVLQLVQGRWQTDKPFSWTEKQAFTQIRAYYPAPDYASFYTADGLLKPIYFASGTFVPTTPISLIFKPFFARLTFRLPAALNVLVQTVTLMPTHALDSIDWATGCQEVILATSEQAIHVSTSADGCYSLDIPVTAEGGEIVVQTTEGKQYRAQYTRNAWDAGREYEVVLKWQAASENNPEDDSPGIRTSADFIQWLELVWKGTVESEGAGYGTKAGAVWTYVLKNDIDLSDADNQRLQGMADYRGSIKFNHRFDGQHHCIRGLKLPLFKRYRRMALFPLLGTTGEILRLHLKHVQAVLPSALSDGTTFTMGAMAAYNTGSIRNCSLEDATFDGCQLPAKLANAHLGGLVGMQEGGKMLNCGVRQVEVNLSASAPWSFGAIIGTIRSLFGGNAYVDGFHVNGGRGGYCIGQYQSIVGTGENSSFTHLVLRNTSCCIFGFIPPSGLFAVYYPVGVLPYSGFTSPKTGFYAYDPQTGYLHGSSSVTLLEHLRAYPSTREGTLPWKSDGNGWVTFDFVP